MEKKRRGKQGIIKRKKRDKKSIRGRIRIKFIYLRGEKDIFSPICMVGTYLGGKKSFWKRGVGKNMGKIYTLVISP